MYGSETWTLRKADVTRLEAFEMWTWRKLAKIRWIDKITNVEVLARVEESRTLMNDIRKRKRKWVGHLLRHEGQLRDVLEGRMEGKQPRGRKRMMMLDEIKGEKSYCEIKRQAEDRVFWRKLT